MNEIEKMYENAGVELIEDLEWVCQNPDHCVYQNLSVTPENCIGCEHFEREMRYPPFTPAKQIELIKYFSNNYNISINKDNNIFRLLFTNKDRVHNFYTSGVGFAEQLALFVISRYKNQILSEEEKQQIKEILK